MRRTAVKPVAAAKFHNVRSFIPQQSVDGRHCIRRFGRVRKVVAIED